MSHQRTMPSEEESNSMWNQSREGNMLDDNTNSGVPSEAPEHNDDNNNNVNNFNTIRHTVSPGRNETMTVHLTTNCGKRIEMHNVPRRFYASELEVLIMKGTSLEHGKFEILHEGNKVKPLSQLESYIKDDGPLELEMRIAKNQDMDKIILGERAVTLKSGLTVPLVCKKVFIPEEPCSHEDTLEVKGTLEESKVKIQWLPRDYHKAFIGGYRNIVTHVRYHHAWAQTPHGKPPKIDEPEIPYFSRETQTYKMKHFGQTTVNNMSTQFPKPGYFVSNANDELKIPGPYETADEFWERKLRNIIIIQKYARRWLARRKMGDMRKMREAMLEWEKTHEAKMKEEKERQRKRDYDRRLHPKTQADFDRLFNALEKWKRERIAEIESRQLEEAERKTALALLLDEEAELIAAIGRHQLCATQKNNERARLKLLKKAAAPIRWTSAVTGRPIQVETPQTQRGNELLDIYISLSLEKLTDEERLDLLLTTKRTVKQYKFNVCKQLIKLIDREGELIMMGVKEEYLNGLRKRIKHHFAKFCEIPEVNPEIARYLKVPTGSREKISESLKGDVHYCLSCDRYLRNEAYPLSARATHLAPCEACRRLDNRARKRIDFEEYERMLIELREKELRLVEQARLETHQKAKEAELDRLERFETPQPETICKLDGTDFSVLNSNPFPFLVDKRDIQFLVDNVWERRSVISGWLDIMDLVFTRWRLDEPWSPWNTILVTREEAEAHEHLGNFPLEQAYANAMLDIVNQRLVMARNAFSRLLKNGIKMAYEQVVFAQRMKKPEPTQEWLDAKRERLPPLAKYNALREDNPHEATYQPPDFMLPAIRGEKTLMEVRQANKSK